MLLDERNYLKENENNINKFAAKAFSCVCIIPYLILLLVCIGLFNFDLKLAVFGAVFSTICAIFFYILLVKEKCVASFKYILCLVMQIIIFVYSFDCDMDITVMYMLSPLTALLYLNPTLEIITCIFSIVSMMIGIIIQAPVTVLELYHDVTPLLFILTTGGAHFVEMLVATVLLVMITILSRRLMNATIKKNEEIISIQNNLAYSFADMIESRDGTTGEHVKRTSKVVSLIIQKIKENPELYPNIFSEGELDLISMSAPLHDIGKLKVPDSILSKPGKLTDDEFEIIKTHSEEGAKIIDKTMANIEDPFYVKIAHDMALYHHEKWGGKGYPEGIAGEQIPICARIMAVADVFDALCSKRSYKKAFTIDEAYQIMNESKESHFEPALVDILNDLRDEMLEIYPQEEIEE